MSEAIILFSHGSLLCGAGESLGQLARRMREEGDTPIVEVGYLNYSDPSFEVAFERCLQAGATRIIVVPYFLVAGKFVTVDLPRQVANVKARYPAIEVRIADAMRAHSYLADALLTSAQQAVP